MLEALQCNKKKISHKQLSPSRGRATVWFTVLCISRKRHVLVHLAFHRRWTCVFHRRSSLMVMHFSPSLSFSVQATS